jgi:copper homeostasis protein
VKPRIILEIAVDCPADAAAAVRAGADRLELCADLAGHGFTPAEELVRSVAAMHGTRCMAMVRPRGIGPAPAGAAGFIYGREEWSLMLSEAERLLGAGAGGIVFGSLDADGSPNLEQVREMVLLARGRETIFHRGIDLTLDPVRSAGQLADLGVTRVLTAGMSLAATAAELGARCGRMAENSAAGWQGGGNGWIRRLERVADLVKRVSGRIEILPGGGVRAGNALELLAATGCTQVHSSGRVDGRFDAAAVAGLRAAIDSAR